MPLKSSKTCCGFAWIPDKTGVAPLLATASYAGFVGRNFSSSSFLEIREVDVLKTDDSEMKVCCKQVLPAQACRLDWSPLYGKRGIIAVGCANGVVYVYDVQELLDEKTDHSSALLCTIQGKERGAVKGCHFNGTQLFLATGYERGEWHLWSLQQIHAPVLINVDRSSSNSTLSSVSHLLWHPFIPRVLCVASLDEVTIWNTESRSVMKSIDTRALRAGCIAWNPLDTDHAEQLAIGCSREPPVIQLWNMNEFAPKRELIGHEKGITGLSWCRMRDNATLLASCDNAGGVRLWDPHQGVKIGHISIQFNLIDVQWCPSLPFVLATSSSEPLLSVHSVLEALESDEYAFLALGQSSNPSYRASMNLSRNLACLKPHSTSKIHITNLRCPITRHTADPIWSDLLQHAPDCGFPDSFLAIPREASSDRSRWLTSAGFNLFSALECSKSSRQPLVDYLSCIHKETDATPTDNESKEKEDANTQIAKYVAGRKLEEAVHLCLNEKKFDDAYALAGLGGAELFQKVHRYHLSYMVETHPERHHLRYALAMATGDYANLCASCSEHEMPWKELLLLFTLHVGEDYKELCLNLGNQRMNVGDMDGALTCFACCRDVDRCIDLWHHQALSIPELVYRSLLLEEVTDTKSESSFFSDCLFQCGYRILKAGDVSSAVSYLERAAKIGHSTALDLLDRIMQGKGSATSRTQGASILPDQPSQACVRVFQSLLSVGAAAPEQVSIGDTAVGAVSQRSGGYPSSFIGSASASSGFPAMQGEVGGTGAAPTPGMSVPSSRFPSGSNRIHPTSISSFSSAKKQRASTPLAANSFAGSPYTSPMLPNQPPQQGFPQQLPGGQQVPPPPRPGQPLQQGFPQQLSGGQQVPPPPRPGQPLQQGFPQQPPPGGQQVPPPPRPGQPLQQGFPQQPPPGGQQVPPPPRPGQPLQQGFPQQPPPGGQQVPPPPRPGQPLQQGFPQHPLPGGQQVPPPPRPGQPLQQGFPQQLPGGQQVPPPSLRPGYSTSEYGTQGYLYGF